MYSTAVKSGRVLFFNLSFLFNELPDKNVNILLVVYYSRIFAVIK